MFLSFGSDPDAGATNFCTTRATPHCPTWGWGRIGPCAPMAQSPSVLRVRADRGGHLFRTKLDIVVHNLAHQLLNHLLSDDAILLARQFCNCLRGRIGASMLASDRSTVTPLSPPPHQGANSTHPSPSAR